MFKFKLKSNSSDGSLNIGFESRLCTEENTYWWDTLKINTLAAGLFLAIGWWPFVSHYYVFCS